MSPRRRLPWTWPRDRPSLSPLRFVWKSKFKVPSSVNICGRLIRFLLLFDSTRLFFDTDCLMLVAVCIQSTNCRQFEHFKPLCLLSSNKYVLVILFAFRSISCFMGIVKLRSKFDVSNTISTIFMFLIRFAPLRVAPLDFDDFHVLGIDSIDSTCFSWFVQ